MFFRSLRIAFSIKPHQTGQAEDRILKTHKPKA